MLHTTLFWISLTATTIIFLYFAHKAKLVYSYQQQYDYMDGVYSAYLRKAIVSGIFFALIVIAGVYYI